MSRYQHRRTWHMLKGLMALGVMSVPTATLGFTKTGLAMIGCALLGSVILLLYPSPRATFSSLRRFFVGHP